MRCLSSLALVLCILLNISDGARLRSIAGKVGHLVSAGVKKKSGASATALRLRTHASPDVDASEVEAVTTPMLDAALSKINGWVEESRQADETGTLGMPPAGSSIIIDGPSVAWAHGEHKRFSTFGLKHVVDFFLDKGYPSVMALVSLTYFQEPPKGSGRTRVADNISALAALKDAGHVHVVPPGASEEGMLLQYAWSQEAFVVSNNDFADFKLACSPEEEEWVRTHHIYFTWHAGLFLPTCDRDHRAPRQAFTSKRMHDGGFLDADANAADIAAEHARKAAAEEETNRQIAQALPPFGWTQVRGCHIICVCVCVCVCARA